MSWMEGRIESDVQTAIQSQTIQTALEANTSAISNAGFQSYLTSAPIPRLYYDSSPTTFTAGANVTATWNVANSFDPYSIMNPTTGIMTIPIDGFYNGMWTLHATATAGGSLDVSWQNSAKTIFYTRDFPSGYIPAPTNYGFDDPFQFPLRQGNQILVNVGNGTASDLTLVICRISLVWVAPYNLYVGGNSG